MHGNQKFVIPYEELVRHVEEGRHLSETAEKFGCDPVTVWENLKKHGLRSRGRFRARKEPLCCRCGCRDPKNFRKRTGKQYENYPDIWAAWCNTCTSTNARDYKRKNRQRITEHLGGKCITCGFKEYPAALEAHHLDPAKKDVSAGNMVGWKWERILKEIKDCILLCANCHRGYHNDELPPDKKKMIDDLAAVVTSDSAPLATVCACPTESGARLSGTSNREQVETGQAETNDPAPKRRRVALRRGDAVLAVAQKEVSLA